jgi:hypothetical protein
MRLATNAIAVRSSPSQSPRRCFRGAPRENVQVVLEVLADDTPSRLGLAASNW